MTGIEIAAASALTGKVVEHAGKEIAKDSNSIRQGLTEQAKQTPEFADAAHNKAKRIAIRQEIATMIYKPITDLFGISNKYFETEFESDMATKLADVPEENIIPPKPSLAAPAMQQLGYSLDEPDLKKLYLNILTTASDNRIKDDAHPSFVEVVKQLSADEIPLLEAIIGGPRDVWPIIQLKVATSGEEGYQQLTKHVMAEGPLNVEAAQSGYLATFIDNWIRLGLIEVRYDIFMTAEDAYSWVPESGAMLAYENYFESAPTKTVDFDKGMLRRTDYARTFARAVGINSYGHSN